MKPLSDSTTSPSVALAPLVGPEALISPSRHRLRPPALLLALGLLLAAAGPALAAEDTVDLKPQWKVGQRMVQQYKTTQKQKIGMPNAAAPMQQATEQTQEVAVSVVKQRPEGGHELSVEFLTMKIESKMGETVMLKYDSKTDKTATGENPMSGIFQKLVGAKFTLLTTPEGEVEKVEGLEKVLESLAAGLPELFAGMVQSMVNSDAVKQMSGLPPNLPKEPVAVGHEWPVKTEVALGPLGTMVLDLRYKYTGLERKRDYSCAVLDHKGFITSKAGSGTGPVSFSGVSGTTSGRSWYVPSVGTIIDSFADQKMKLKMKAMGQDVSMDMDQRVLTKMTEVTTPAE
ncbi:MAG: hypothetical protein HS113_20845 [Verrucomicrobiales bacterium]|nr:hypothetical protein [Verrucomicrobiales bacterium]